MNRKTTYMLIASLFSLVLMNGQEDKKIKKADNKFEQRSYTDAINSYEDLVEEGYSSREIFTSLGNANYLNANYKAAAEWYGKLLELDGADADPEYMYRYAQTLKSLEKYEESDQWMDKFAKAKGNDGRAVKFAENSNYLDKIKENSGRYDIKSLSINSSASDYAPSMNGENLVFSTARDTGRISRNIHKWNNKPFTNLYTATATESGDFMNASKLSTVLNKKTHESSTAFTKDGTTVYFTRNNSENGKFSRDTKGVSRLKAYRATLTEGQWTNVTELPFNSAEYSVAHPTLSADEKKLYFASDMPGTIGSSDIFVVDINEDGSYSTPKNLGPEINTEARETFPFVTENDILYFASDGHPGLGGLDVFATKMDDLNNIHIVNVGKPVNGKQDDFSFIINDVNKKGFFASNREGGLGNDDIYGFTENEEIDLSCNIHLDGTVRDRETGDILADANITLLNENGDVISESASDSHGLFSLEGDCRDGDYKLVAQKDEFDSGNTMFKVLNSKDVSNLEIALEKTIKRAEVGTDLVTFLNLSPVYFDLNKSKIRSVSESTIKQVAEYMNAFPDLKVEVRSHTDAKAGNTYNKRLSERRAQETSDYLIQLGIDKARVSGKGFGETQLINDCTVWEKCDESQNLLNRRSEFIVVE